MRPLDLVSQLCARDSDFGSALAMLFPPQCVDSRVYQSRWVAAFDAKAPSVAIFVPVKDYCCFRRSKILVVPFLHGRSQLSLVACSVSRPKQPP